MKKLFLSLVFVFISTSAFSEGTVSAGIKTHPVLVTKLIELPSKCKITEFTGSASIGVRNTDERHNPVKVGDIVDQTSIVFMGKNSKIVLLGKENTKINLESKQNGESFTFSMRFESE